jgi:hypothetical protein
LDERFVKRLLASMKCGTCNKHYEPGHINILGHQDNVWFLSVYCTTCQSQGLVAAMIKNGKTPEVVTDLSEAEIAKFTKNGKITADDILDMHSFLKDFEGDFSNVFKNDELKK